MFVPVILGTAREGRRSIKPAQFVIDRVREYGLETRLIDVRDYRLAATDRTLTTSKARKFASIVKKSDALIIVSPEYNFSYPGELKMMLDMLHDEYKHKPVGLCGVSSGRFGGIKAVELLRLLCVGFGMVPISFPLYFSNVEKLFNEKGDMVNNEYGVRIKKFLDELVWFVKKFNS